MRIFKVYSYFGLSMYAMAWRGCRFSAVNILPWMREMSLWAKSRFVVKLRLASSRLLTKRQGTGPSRLSHSNISVVRDHSSRRHVATASLKQKDLHYLFVNKYFLLSMRFLTLILLVFIVTLMVTACYVQCTYV
jgi:hypothetical protein